MIFGEKFISAKVEITNRHGMAVAGSPTAVSAIGYSKLDIVAI
jgi:hypothetical protein